MKDDVPPPMEAPDPGDRDYAITRLTRERHGKAGWQVGLIRRGRMVQGSFHDRMYGGREAALHVARAYRDAVLEVMPPLSRRDMRRIVRRNRPACSSVTGVTFQAASDKRAAYWLARIELPGEPARRRGRKRTAEPPAEGNASPGATGEVEAGDGTAPAPGAPTRPRRKPKRPPRRTRVRYFSVDKLGFEEARRQAEAERERMLAALEDGDRPALRSPRAAALHEALRSGGGRGDEAGGKEPGEKG